MEGTVDQTTVYLLAMSGADNCMNPKADVALRHWCWSSDWVVKQHGDGVADQPRSPSESLKGARQYLARASVSEWTTAIVDVRI
jgi:hypothetical protein